MQTRAELLLFRRIQLHRARSPRLARARRALQPHRQRTRALRAPLQPRRPALSPRRRMTQTRAAQLLLRRAPLIRARLDLQLPLQAPPTRMLLAAPRARARLPLTRMPLPAQQARRLQAIRMPPALLTRTPKKAQDRSCLKPLLLCRYLDFWAWVHS